MWSLPSTTKETSHGQKPLIKCAHLPQDTTHHILSNLIGGPRERTELPLLLYSPSPAGQFDSQARTTSRRAVASPPRVQPLPGGSRAR
jgi:hypothetical protein